MSLHYHMDKSATNILEGEASESDEEVSDYPGFVKNTMVTESSQKTTSEGPSSSVVVSGEAVESDDDETGGMMLPRDFKISTLQNQVEELEIQEKFSVSIEQEKPKFESPFHRKIYENNFALRLGIVRTHLERHDHITNRLKMLLPHGNRSQHYVQETLSQYRAISETTKELNDNLEALLRQTDLPRLKEPFPL